MSAATVEVIDQGARAALQTLAARVHNMQPVFHTLGEGMVERTKHRFDTSTAPDGTPWKRNSDATLKMLATRLTSVKSNRKKDGSLNARGARALAAKKPLVESGFLRQQIVQNATPTALTVEETALYAAIHQWGGKAGKGLSVTIPARPSLPIYPDGSLYPQERDLILAEINGYLLEGLQ